MATRKGRRRRGPNRSPEEQLAELRAQLETMQSLTREFSPEAVQAERERLELSARDYGELVGVSMLTIYNWESGKTSPQAKQVEKWLAVKGIGKRKAWRRLGYA